MGNDKFLLCIADVSGKGVPAALLMSNFQAALRILVRQHLSLKKIVHELNYLVFQNTQGESFITAFLMEYDLKNKQLLYINAGHNPPFLFSSNLLNMSLLKDGTTILGSFKELPFLQITELNLIDNFFFFAFTDGLTETTNEDGEEFGMQQLEQFLLANKHTEPQLLHQNLIEKLNIFKGKNYYADDITLLSCSVIV
jgi:sigma-B regulation protein RsbU (phosphoserine phosphatase)